MTKYKMTVEIPDGKYCVDKEGDVFCGYMGDAHYEAGCCSLIPNGDNTVRWEGDKFERIPKHPECPSLKEKK